MNGSKTNPSASSQKYKGCGRSARANPPSSSATFANVQIVAVAGQESAAPEVTAIAPMTMLSRLGRLLSGRQTATTGPNAPSTRQRTTVVAASSVRRGRGRRSQNQRSSKRPAVGSRTHSPASGRPNIMGSVKSPMGIQSPQMTRARTLTRRRISSERVASNSSSQGAALPPEIIAEHEYHAAIDMYASSLNWIAFR